MTGMDRGRGRLCLHFRVGERLISKRMGYIKTHICGVYALTDAFNSRLCHFSQLLAPAFTSNLPNPVSWQQGSHGDQRAKYFGLGEKIETSGNYVAFC